MDEYFQLCAAYDRAKAAFKAEAVPSEIVNEIEDIGLQLHSWYTKNAPSMSEYEIDVSGHITNIATLLASQGEWDRATSMLQVARQISVVDWRPLIRLAAIQLKRKLHAELFATMELVEQMLSNDALKLLLPDPEHESFMKLFSRLKSQMPKFPLLSLPLDLFYAALDQLRHPADFWAQDVRSLCQVSHQANVICKGYLKRLYTSCSHRILSHPLRDSLLSAANQLRRAIADSCEYAIRRVIQDNITHSETLRKQFPAGPPRKGLDIYCDVEVLPQITVSDLENELPQAEWTRTVRFLSGMLHRFERLPKFIEQRCPKAFSSIKEVNDPAFLASVAAVCRSEIEVNIKLIPVDQQLGYWDLDQGMPTLPECCVCPGDDEIPVGASKFGGFADLPLEWIEPDCIPRLIFQINFSEIPRMFLSAAKLPEQGILYVLTDASHYDPAGDAYVRYWPGPLKSPSQLQRVAPSPQEKKSKQWWWDYYKDKMRIKTVQRNPDAHMETITTLETSVNKGYLIGNCFVWQAGTLEFRDGFCFPITDYGDHVVGSGLPWEYETNLNMLRKESTSGQTHRLLGYSSPFQRTYENVFQRSCDAAAFRKAYKRLHGVDLEQMVNENSFHNCCKRENRICDRRLLLELETDWKAGLMWGDSGIMYIFTSQEHLDRRSLTLEDKSAFHVEFDWH
eukprot:TRINITY_DN10233_c0_g1_i1.p1 TRINITY_DN10233_c0_g1~~TRINITY_DN10233_c0_g1_i1.p1  ORF type:complete len:679 (-),score=66.02 TRINITY_DN10233_c0_g1_i1:89-2125(-)